jgi:hypothetical protein
MTAGGADQCGVHATGEAAAFGNKEAYGSIARYAFGAAGLTNVGFILLLCVVPLHWAGLCVTTDTWPFPARGTCGQMVVGTSVGASSGKLGYLERWMITST